MRTVRPSRSRGRSTAGSGIRPIVAGIATALIFFALAPVVGASSDPADAGSDVEIFVPINTVVHAPAGSETILSNTPTPDDLVGSTCAVTATAENQASVHPSNDLVVKSSTEIVLEDVEGVSGGVVTAAGTVVLDDAIVVTLVMGPDEVFSAGIMVAFDCPPGETGGTTLTTSTTSSTTPGETTTTPGESTTTVEVGGKVVTTTPGTTSPSGEGTATTLATEVLGTGVLPFTGPQDGAYALYGLALIATGALLLVGVRSVTGSRSS